ncbi:MAG: energy transducer TonB [Rhodanobacteraceae bacterium]
MATQTVVRGFSWDWLRVGAWSGSVAAHLVALLLVALPVTVPLIRRAPAPPIDVRWIETAPPEPVLPEPPPPTVPDRIRVRTPLPQASTPIVPEVTPLQAAATDAPSVPDTVAKTTDTPAAPSDIGSGGATQNLAYASPVQPRYPPGSARAHEEGTVILHVLVDETGVPQQIDIQRSSGHVRLDNAARDAVSHARFRPVLRNGTAIPAWGLVPIAFRLDRG